MKKELTFTQKVLRIKKAGLDISSRPRGGTSEVVDDIMSLDKRIEYIFELTNDKRQRKSTDMMFFVLYDISSNKVRTQVVKYLERKGCIRVQRSVFLADLDISVYNQIKQDLTEVQAAYENNDSILVVPISTDYLKAMKIIGQQLQLDVIMHNKSTLFF